MRVEITSKEITINDTIRAQIDKKYAKLLKFNFTLINPHFVISVDKKHIKTLEANISFNKGKLFARVENEDLTSGINDLFNKLEIQLLRHLDKVQDKHKHA